MAGVARENRYRKFVSKQHQRRLSNEKDFLFRHLGSRCLVTSHHFSNTFHGSQCHPEVCQLLPSHPQSEQACRGLEQGGGGKDRGRVKVEYYPGGSLLKGKQIYDGVVDGIADIGFSVAAYTAGRFPTVSAFDLPFGYSSGVVATKVVNDVFTSVKANDFKDTKLMYLHAHGPGLINVRNKEVKTLEDLKGLRIRSTGMSAETVKALGATPTAMEMSDAYESLEKGVVDGSAHPFEANLGWKLGEVIKYNVRSVSCAYTTTFLVAMNKDKWAALDPKDQAAIEAINKEWIAKHGQAWDDADKAAKEAFLAKKRATPLSNSIPKSRSAGRRRWPRSSMSSAPV
jgi:TRAP-type transport system periplasmic protein